MNDHTDFDLDTYNYYIKANGKENKMLIEFSHSSNQWIPKDMALANEFQRLAANFQVNDKIGFYELFKSFDFSSDLMGYS